MYVREYQDIAEPFLGKQQQSITLEFALENHEALSFFTLRAFQYYLPAYMRVVLLYPGKESDILPEHLLHDLTLPTQSNLLDTFMIKLKR
jgi:hypothetical protein